MQSTGLCSRQSAHPAGDFECHPELRSGQPVIKARNPLDGNEEDIQDTCEDTSMNCPVCSTSLKSTRYEMQSIDACQKCGGVWLDQGELQATLNSLMSKIEVDYQTIEEAYRKKPEMHNRMKQPIRKCPRCTVDMHAFNYYCDSGILLDKCPSCEGIWADRGEIRKAAKYTKGDPLERYGKASVATQMRYLASSDPRIAVYVRRSRFVALGIAGLCLVFGFLFGGLDTLSRVFLDVLVSLTCIFFGGELSRLIRGGALLPFLGIALTRESPGCLVVSIGWVLLLLSLIATVFLGQSLFFTFILGWLDFRRSLP